MTPFRMTAAAALVAGLVGGASAQYPLPAPVTVVQPRVVVVPTAPVVVAPPVVYRPYPVYPVYPAAGLGIGFGPRGGISVGGVLPVGPVVVGGGYYRPPYHHHHH